MDIDSNFKVPDDGAVDDPTDQTFATRPKTTTKGKGTAAKGKTKLSKKSKKDNTCFEVPDSPVSNLHPDDPSNFLKLCTALVLVTAHSITEEDIQKADQHI